MLSGRGYEKVYNLSGGIKAWQNEVAVGPEDTGLFLFETDFDAETAIITGFGLEMGLLEFYLSMVEKVNSDSAKKIFTQLAEIEILHQQQLLELYEEISGEKYELEAFSQKVVSPAMEGGLTTEEYLERYSVDFEEELEVLSLALAIEAQALDLYLRAADRSSSVKTRRVLQKIADEERNHIAYLGKYIDESLTA